MGGYPIIALYHLNPESNCSGWYFNHQSCHSSTADKVSLVHVKAGQFYMRVNINKALKTETRQNRIIIAALILRVTIVSSRPDTPMKHWNLNTNNKAYSKYIFDIICFLPLTNLAWFLNWIVFQCVMALYFSGCFVTLLAKSLSYFSAPSTSFQYDCPVLWTLDLCHISRD